MANTNECASPSSTQPFDEITVPDIIRRISDGALSIDDLPVDLRRACVSHLTIDGYSCSEICAVLKMAERTVRRDRSAARKDEAIAPDLYLGDELLGEYHRLTLASIQRLTRLAREPETPPYARLWAEESMSRCYQRLIDIAHKLNYTESGRERLNHHRQTDPGAKMRSEEIDTLNKEMLRKPVW